MQHGDLSNQVAPKIVVVFEGAIGILSRDNQKHFDKFVKKNDWWSAVNCYDLQDIYLRKLLDLTYRENFNVVIMTWMGKDAAEALNELMDEENIPIHRVSHSTPERLARDLAYNPDIIAVYDPNPEHRMTYGAKGIHLVDPFQLGRF